MAGPLRVQVARTLEELERLRPAWEELPWSRDEAAYPFFSARLASREGVIGPFAVVVGGENGPVAGLAGRLELRRLSTTVGYRNLYAPDVRALQVVDGGIAGTGPALAALATAAGEALATGEADVVALPPLEVGSEAAAAFDALGGPLTRQPLIASWARRLLDLPDSYEELLASLSHKTRKNVRRDARALETEYGARLQVAALREPGDLDRLVHDADRVAASAYQRRIGGGFADTPEQRELARVGLEHGWLTGYLLYLDGAPIAYWLCSPFGRTLLLRTGAYDPAYADRRVGIHLLTRVIADACADPGLDVLDFGPGDAAYKQQFSNESRLERNALIFAPSFRARRINVTRTAILGPARLASSALDAAGLTTRVRARLRR